MITFENVGLRYGMGGEILRDISFRIQPQSFQFLTGPSGAGKTTLLKLILFSLKPTRGLISLFGRDAAALDKDAITALRRRIGVVFQDFRLLSHLHKSGTSVVIATHDLGLMDQFDGARRLVLGDSRLHIFE